MNLLKKFMRNDNADLEEENYDDLYVMPDELKMDAPEEQDEVVSALNNPARKEPEIHPASADKVSLKLLQPKSHAEAFKIADKLKEGCIVLLDISGLEKSVTSHLVDFLTGVAYVLGGEMIRTNKHTIVISPSGVDISSFATVEEVPAEVAQEPAAEEVALEEEEPASEEN